MRSWSAFNRTYRTEVLDAYVFTHLEDVRLISDDFLTTYNTERPHDSLGRVPPLTFLPRPNHTSEPTSQLSTCWGSLPHLARQLARCSGKLRPSEVAA